MSSDEPHPSSRLSEPRCTRAGCCGNGRWLPALLLYAPIDYGEHPPAKCVFNLPTCGLCRRQVGLADFLTDELWATLVGRIRGEGKAEPDRSRTLLIWVPNEKEKR